MGEIFFSPHSPYDITKVTDTEGAIESVCIKRVMLLKSIILLHEKFLQFDWLRPVVFQLNLKYLHVKLQTFCG